MIQKPAWDGAHEPAPPTPEAPQVASPAASSVEPEAAATTFEPRPAVPRRAPPPVKEPTPDDGATNLTQRQPTRDVPDARRAVGERTAELAGVWGGGATEAPTEAPTTFVVKPVSSSAGASGEAVFAPSASEGSVAREVGARTVGASPQELQRAAQNLPDPVIARTEFVARPPSGPPPMPASSVPTRAPEATASSSRTWRIAGAAIVALVLVAVLVAALR